MKLNWEEIDDYTFRAWIPGGWLVKIQQVSYESGSRGEAQIKVIAASITFVPDPHFQW